MGRQIGRYNEETGKVEWCDEAEFKPTTTSGESAAIWGPVEIHAVGLPGAPVVTSRNEYKQLLKQHGCVEMGNERPPVVRAEHERRRT